MLKQIKLITCLVLLIITGSCKKYLDQKPDKSLVIPTTLKDLQALLDNYRKVNLNDPSGGEMSSDNYYLTTEDWNNQDEGLRNLYVWEKGDFFPSFNNMWNNASQAIYIPNVVLDNLGQIERNANTGQEWDNVKGEALYLRAREFHLLAITWALAYDSLTATDELGIPLRLNSDFNIPSKRANLENTYKQIIDDLKQSIALLPEAATSLYRPSKTAAYAMLARVFLSMREYHEAGIYSDSALKQSHDLMDFNTLNPTSSRPIASLNKETLFYSAAGNWGPLSNSKAKIDSVLYNKFDSNDLRRVIYFKSNNDGTFGFKGTYTGGTAQLTGPATDEVYLMHAECLAREGNISAAMDDLNTLLVTRWKYGTFIPFIAANKTDALNLILLERRKELIYRELRWMDIKRLNEEGANIVLKRSVDGKSYVLPPNDPRYALPFPKDVINLTGMKQNPR